MPTYKGISLAFHSQFDIETLPEYLPRPHGCNGESETTKHVPTHIDDRTATCSVYVRALPGSQFWISYAVSPPVPANQQFLFKLFINNAHIVSWSTSKDEKWKGKVVFALYERQEEDGNKRGEKRVLCFTPPDRKTGKWNDVASAFDEGAVVEIRVHRANGRERVERQLGAYSDTENSRSRRGIHLVNAGRAGPEHPKRFYKVALIDPTDQPFASFRYYYRTWEQLRELGLHEEISSGPGEDTELSVIEPEEVNATTSTEDGDSVEKNAKDAVRGDSSREDPRTPPRAYIPTGAPGSGSGSRKSTDSSSEHGDKRCSPSRTSPLPYRQSVPPAWKLEAPRLRSRVPPSIPVKKDGHSDTSYRPHPAYPMDEWVIRTPSPVKSIRDGISTPPLGKKKGLTAGALMCAIASTWKRRGTSISETSNDTRRGTAARSVS